MSLEAPQRKVSGQLQERRAAGRDFQILGDVTEKLRAPRCGCQRNCEQIGIVGP